MNRDKEALILQEIINMTKKYGEDFLVVCQSVMDSIYEECPYIKIINDIPVCSLDHKICGNENFCLMKGK